MHLREAEKVLKVYHHHPTPFLKILFKIMVGTFPFFLLVYLFGPSMPTDVYIWAHIAIFVLFALITINSSLIYWLDRLIVTNQRVVFVDWQFLTISKEYETELDDIQDIHTKERGILAVFRIFDYGIFYLQTASHTTIIEFTDAPDPEGIRQFVYSVRKN